MAVALAAAIAAVIGAAAGTAGTSVAIVQLVDSKTHHNTHVANGSGTTIFVEVRGPDGLKSHVINSGDVVNFGTAKGRVTITVYFDNQRGHYEAVKEVPSDISVVVGCVNGKLQMARVKYGTLWQVDE